MVNKSIVDSSQKIINKILYLHYFKLDYFLKVTDNGCNTSDSYWFHSSNNTS